MPSTVRRRIVIGACAALIVLGATRQANADGFISPFYGYNFGGDSGCPEIADCSGRTRNLGVAIGSLGSVVGSEFEFNFIDNFFGQPTLGTVTASSNVFSMMGNVMFAPKVGVIQPYVLTGLGLIKTHVEFTPSALVSLSNNLFAWDIGGGVIGFFTPHVGIRGDVRYFHSFQSLSIIDLNINDSKIDYGRVSGGVVLKF
jgi:opacity protein-like surface antigen